MAAAVKFTLSTISIHALREEGDEDHAAEFFVPGDFYPRPPRGGRPSGIIYSKLRSDFYPRPPRGGRRSIRDSPSTSINFYPRPPRGGRPDCLRWSICRAQYFYPRPPRGGRRSLRADLTAQVEISIHALREEGDSEVPGMYAAKSKFLSTPSARRATALCELDAALNKISIHALREEGDAAPTGGFQGGSRFLSTPSARRATPFAACWTIPTKISIHALREEGDPPGHQQGPRSSPNFYPRPPRGGRHRPRCLRTAGQQHFYPRPPRGGRPGLASMREPMYFISIHALREEGDSLR